MSNLRDIYSFKIIVGEAIVTDGVGSTFISAGILESIEDIYSVCTIIIEGSESFLNDAAIVDGTPIKIFIQSKDLNFSYVYYYRVVKIEVSSGTNKSNRYIIMGYSDFFPLFEAPTSLALYNKSSEVFKAVADKYNLESEIDLTNDEQLWVCSEQNLKEWLTFVASRGWINETSGMFWCLDRHRCLLYKDINTLFSQKTSYIFRPGTGAATLDSKTMYYLTSALNNNSGEENIKYNGYGGLDYNFNLLTYNLNEVSAKKVKAYSNIININKDISHGLKQSFYPIDTGNFHKHYYLAHDQNSRVLSTFSSYHNLVFQFFQPVRLCQIADLITNTLTNSMASKALNLKVMITKIQINFSNTAVSMNVEACSQGFNGISITTY